MPDWDQIVAEHGPDIVRLARRILGPGPDAEDVIQEVFLEVFQFQQKNDVDHWAGLLRRVATHRALDRLRRRRETKCLDEVEFFDRRESPVQEAVAGELAERLRLAIAQLPDRQAAVFSLRYFDDRSYEQIAEILSIEPGAVGVALHKARLRLRTLLDPEVKGVES